MLNYQFESMEPIMVKGKEKPVKLYFPTADKVEQEIQASLNSSGILGLGLVSSALSSPIPSPPHTFFYSPFRASSRAFQTSSPCATRCVVCPTWHTGCLCLSGAAWRLQPDGVPDARRQGPQSLRSHCHDTLTSHPQTLPRSPSHSPTHMQPDGVPGARRQAEAAFYDPKMLALLYFPEDEKYGIPSTLFWTVFNFSDLYVTPHLACDVSYSSFYYRRMLVEF